MAAVGIARRSVEGACQIAEGFRPALAINDAAK